MPSCEAASSTLNPMTIDLSLSPILRTVVFLIVLGAIHSIGSTQTAPEPPKLTLKDCIEDALLNNLSLRADRVDPEIAREETDVAR